MTLRREHLGKHPAAFRSLTGLEVGAFDGLLPALLAAFHSPPARAEDRSPLAVWVRCGPNSQSEGRLRHEGPCGLPPGGTVFTNSTRQAPAGRPRPDQRRADASLT